MEGEYFYGAVLDKNGATVTWNMSDATDEALGPFYKLLIKQILLGHKAKENEYNVVEVETLSASTGVTIPIAVLKVGENRSLLTNLEFPEAPVNFKLVEGNGPVYIHGNQIPMYVERVEEAEDEMEPIEEEMEDEEESKQTSKKRKMNENGQSGAKPANGTDNKQKNKKNGK